MTLTEYIDKIKLENNIQYDTQDIEKHVKEMAKKEPTKNGCAVVDDETVAKWIIEYKPEEKKSAYERAKDEKKEAAKEEPIAVPAGKPKEEEGEWGHQESLF